MTFEQVLPALRQGKKIRRKSFHPDNYLVNQFGELQDYSTEKCRFTAIGLNDMFADDWEIVDEPQCYCMDKYVCPIHRTKPQPIQSMDTLNYTSSVDSLIIKKINEIIERINKL